jgi:hypothetical protein
MPNYWDLTLDGDDESLNLNGTVNLTDYRRLIVAFTAAEGTAAPTCMFTLYAYKGTDTLLDSWDFYFTAGYGNYQTETFDLTDIVEADKAAMFFVLNTDKDIPYSIVFSFLTQSKAYKNSLEVDIVSAGTDLSVYDKTDTIAVPTIVPQNRMMPQTGKTSSLYPKITIYGAGDVNSLAYTFSQEN